MTGEPIEVIRGSVDDSSFQTTLRNVLKIHTEKLKVHALHFPSLYLIDEIRHYNPEQRTDERIKQMGEKTKNEKTEESNKEKERRHLGKNFGKMKEYKAEKELIQLKEEKTDDIEQRKRIKKLIARDREEVAARSKIEMELRDTTEKIRRQKADEEYRKRAKEQIIFEREIAVRLKKEQDEQKQPKKKQSNLAGQRKTSKKDQCTVS